MFDVDNKHHLDINVIWWNRWICWVSDANNKISTPFDKKYFICFGQIGWMGYITGHTSMHTSVNTTKWCILSLKMRTFLKDDTLKIRMSQWCYCNIEWLHVYINASTVWEIRMLLNVFSEFVQSNLMVLKRMLRSTTCSIWLNLVIIYRWQGYFKFIRVIWTGDMISFLWHLYMDIRCPESLRGPFHESFVFW